MKTNVTISIDSEVKKEVKELLDSKSIKLSTMIENYFRQILEQNKIKKEVK